RTADAAERAGAPRERAAGRDARARCVRDRPRNRRWAVWIPAPGKRLAGAWALVVGASTSRTGGRRVLGRRPGRGDRAPARPRALPLLRSWGLRHVPQRRVPRTGDQGARRLRFATGHAGAGVRGQARSIAGIARSA